MKKGIITLLLLLYITLSFGQVLDDVNKLAPSPNAASLIKDYQVGANYYNGTPTTNIPIYTYSDQGVQIPINLSYGGGNGIKADELPTWVGLGWNLNVGGQITRIVKNQPDEYRALYTLTQLLFGVLFVTRDISSVDVSYLTNHSLLNRTDWAQTTFLNTLNTNSPYSTTLGGAIINNANPLVDFEPDEFSFQANGITGRFYLDYTGNWIAVSDVPGISFEVTPTIRTSIDVGGDKIIPRAIVEFIIKASDGTTYYFGENQTNNPKYIEYNYNGFWARGWNPSGPYTDIMPSTWHLTKIVDKLNQSTILTYKKIGFQSGKSLSYWGTYPPGGYYGSIPSPRSMEKSLTESWYLEKITTNNNVEIQFDSENSNQLASNENIESNSIYFWDVNAPLPSSITTEKNSYPKLTKIKIFEGLNLITTFSFSYIENLNERLKLQYLRQIDANSMVSNEYNFLYTPLQIPGYGSGKTDHWGYYNGVDFFQNNPGPYTYNLLVNSYAQSREPDFNLGKGELLEKIILPTKGIIEFLYEPCKYSKIANTWPFTISDLGIDKIAGGARIHKIIRREKEGVVSEEIEYKYERSGSSLSSGILTSPVPNYVSGNVNEFSFRAEGYNPFNDRGSIVVYPYVTEQSTVNGYKTLEYESFENAGNDQTAILELPSGQHSLFTKNSYNNKRFVRGLLKKESVYDNNFQLLKEIEYTYSHNITSPGKLRNVHFLPYIRWDDQIFRAAAYETDWQRDLITRTSVKEYNLSGFISTQEDIIYDVYGNVKENTRPDSRGKVVKEKFKYCYEYPSGGTDVISQGINYLNTMGIKNTIVEATVIRQNPDGTDANIIGGKIYVFNTQSVMVKQELKLELSYPIPLNNFIESSITGGSFVKDNRYSSIPEADYTAYDSKGDLLGVTDKSGISKCFIWDYNPKYLVADVTGASLSDIAYTSFESDGTGNWTLNSTASADPSAITGKKSYSLDMSSNTAITRSGLSSTKTYIVSYWSFGRNLLNVNGTTSNGKTGRAYLGWGYCEHRIVNPPGGIITITGVSSTDKIDELHLYPEGALMTTNTYSALIGITSHCDANNRINYYDYDAFNRLVQVRDQDNNVVKKICYNYAGQPENCISCFNRFPIWQNTSSPLTCQQGSCGNTGYQLQEQIDINPCSLTYNQTQLIVAGYNSTACPPSTNVTITYQNPLNLTGFTVVYTNAATSQTYTYNIPAGNGSFGCIVPPATYFITISKPGNTLWLTFSCGCKVVDGTSGSFGKTVVSSAACNSITIDNAN